MKFLPKNTKANIIDICKINLLYGDFKIFKSDNNPTKKIKNIK